MGGTLGVIGGTLLGGSSASPYARIQASASVTVTADSAAHTKGAWTELIASSSDAATMVTLCVSAVGSNNVDTATLLDLAVGAAGAETVVVSNIPVGGAGIANLTRWSIPLPLSIASGARISARIQSIVTGGKTATVSIGLLSGGHITPAASLTVLGANTGTSQGVQVGTSWTEIGTTAATYRHLIPVPSLSTTSAAGTTDALDVGTGAASSEVSIGTVGVTTTTSETLYATVGGAPWESYLIMPGAASGTRVVAKRASACDVAVIGVP